MQSEPSGSRLAAKCRSSKQISEPSSTPGSTAPQTVTAITASTPSCAQRADVGAVRDVVGEPHVAGAVAGDVRDVDAGERPARDQRSPHGVRTGSGSPPSKPGSAYVPEPVMIPIAIGGGFYGTV